MEEKVMAENVNVAENSESASSKKRREEKIRKRDPKAWENIHKTISTLTEAEKIETISSKYSDLYDEFRKVSQNCQNLDKSCTLLQKEKEHMRSEQAKSILARSRLENLCRELQKQNKQIKEENITKLKEEEERRKEVAAKFQKTLDELTTVMNENRERNFKLRDDNIDMSKKISELYTEFSKREEDIKRMTKQMELEKQLAKATITKLEFELKAERELWAKERDILQKNLEQTESRNKQLLENIKGMEEHLSVYKGQYEDFESTLDKSNKIFDNCKSEMVKMSKHIVALEKEVNNWKSKWQSSASSLIELSTAKQTQDLHLAAADKKIEQLQKLCRQLQVDRGAFLKLLKANGIEPVSQTCIENPEKPPTPKERELVILKDSLRMLQEQLQDQLKSVPNSTSEPAGQSENITDNSIKDQSESVHCSEGNCIAQNSCTDDISGHSVLDNMIESITLQSTNNDANNPLSKATYEQDSILKLANNIESINIQDLPSPLTLTQANDLENNVSKAIETEKVIQVDKTGEVENQGEINILCSVADQKHDVTVSD